MSLLEAVSHCEFFRSFPSELITRLDVLAQARHYSAGTKLFSEGHAHPDFHVIVAGHVRLDMRVPTRGSVPILSAGPGDLLAWSALLGHSPMTSTAVALEDVNTIAFNGGKLQGLCETNHEIGYHVMRQLATALSRRLVATRLQFLDLFAEHIPESEVIHVIGRPG